MLGGNAKWLNSDSTWRVASQRVSQILTPLRSLEDNLSLMLGHAISRRIVGLTAATVTASVLLMLNFGITNAKMAAKTPNSGAQALAGISTAAPSLRSQTVSWAQAQADSLDQLLMPQWLPFPSGHVSSVQDLIGPDGHAMEVISIYRSHDQRYVLIEQLHSPRQPSVPGASFGAQIGTHPATFYELDSSGSPSAVMVGEGHGVYVSVEAIGFTADELTHIAASLAPG